MERITKKSLTELRSQLESGELSSLEIVETFKNNFEKDNKSEVPLNGYIEFFDDALEQAATKDKARKNGVKKPLLGLPIAIKDNISIKGKLCTCCSKILAGYKAPFNATVIQKLIDAGAVLLGRTNMDEFAMGSSTEFSCYGPSRNPYNREHTPGGSSGGSAAVVAGEQAPASLGTETGGSVRLPAAYCGLYGLKPTYGLFSRYGVVSLSSSLDQVGLLTKTPEDIALLVSVLAGKDNNDLTTADVDFKNFANLKAYTDAEISNLKFVIIDELNDAEGFSEEVKKVFSKLVDWLKSKGAKVENISLPIIESNIAEYCAVVFPEAASSLARFDGIRYGKRNTGTNYDELYIKTRSKNFGNEVKRRILIGNYILTEELAGDIYEVGKKVQKILEKKIDEITSKYDIILSPTSATTAFKLEQKVNDPKAMYLSDLFINFINLTKISAISVPAGLSSVNNLPIGLQFAAGKFAEEKILRLAIAWKQDALLNKI